MQSCFESSFRTMSYQDLDPDADESSEKYRGLSGAFQPGLWNRGAKFLLLHFHIHYSCTPDEIFCCSCQLIWFVPRQISSPANPSLPGRLDGSMEPANEILESASHDRPLVAQTYSAAVTKGTYVPSSPSRHGKEKAGDGAGSTSACCFLLDGCVSWSASAPSFA